MKSPPTSFGNATPNLKPLACWNAWNAMPVAGSVNGTLLCARARGARSAAVKERRILGTISSPDFQLEIIL